MLTLLTKDGRKIGNAIVVSGEDHLELGYVLNIETDFGNRVRMTWPEVLRLWRPGRVEDYDRWRSDRWGLMVRSDDLAASAVTPASIAAEK